MEEPSPGLDERTKKAFDFASDASKQVLTLSTAILTLTITFQKEISGDISGWPRLVLSLAMAIYFLAITFGIVTLLALTGSLGKQDTPGAQTPTIYSPNVVWPSVLQLLTFLFATLLMLIFALAVGLRLPVPAAK